MSTAVREVWTGCPHCFAQPHPGPCVLIAHLPGRHNQKDHAGKKGRSPEEFDVAAAAATSGSDAERIAKGTPPDEAALGAVKSYGQAGYDEVNTSLRTNHGPTAGDSERVQRITDGMDRTMAGSPLPEDVVVTRALGDLSQTLGGRRPRVGMEWVDHGYSSTTTYHLPGAALGPGGGQLRILVPKGTHGFSHDLLDPSEIVLERGLKFRAVRVSRPDADGITHIDVEILGRDS